MEIYPISNHATLPDMPSATNTDHDGRYPLRTEWLQNGFPNRTDSSIAWSDSTPDRTLTIDKTNGSFSYYIAGTKYTKTASETRQITDVEGLHIIYYDGSTLTSIANPTDAQTETVLLSKAWVANVYWDATNSIGELLDERHGMQMSPYTHRELHFTAGTTFFDGLALGDFVISDGADNEDAQFSIATGQIFDEDIKHVINAVNKTTGVTVWYRSNSNWRKTTQTGFKVLTQDGTSSTRLSYDNAGTRTEVTDNKFVLYHIFAWNAIDLNPITIMGQAEYATAKTARIGATTEINSLLLGVLPSKEMKAIATVIFQTKDTYANDVNARVVQTDEGDDYVDWRTAMISPSAAAGDHGLLAGLTDDDHTQYLLIDGTRAMTGNLDMGNNDMVSIDQIGIDLASFGNSTAQLEFGTAVPVISSQKSLYIGFNCYYDGSWKRSIEDLAHHNILLQLGATGEFDIFTNTDSLTAADSAITWDSRLNLSKAGDLTIDGDLLCGDITGGDIQGDSLVIDGVTINDNNVYTVSAGDDLDLRAGSGIINCGDDNIITTGLGSFDTLALTNNISTLTYGDAGVTDDFNIIGRGTAINRFKWTNAAASNEMAMIMTSAAAAWTTNETLSFVSTNRGVKFSANTATFEIELESVKILLDSDVIVITTLPGADPTNAGQLWSDGGVVTVSAG